MTSEDYKATPEQWLLLERSGGVGLLAAESTCILELRARVQALEEAANDRRFEQAKAIIDKPAPAPAGSLVERVADALADEFQPSGTWHDEARAAIREVAAWLREVGNNGSADDLEQEADRG